MAGTAYGIDLVGLEAIRRKLVPDHLLHPPYRAALETVGRIAEQVIRSGAPRGATGQLAAKLTHRLDAKPVPAYVVIRTTATAKRPAGSRATEMTASGKRRRVTFTSKRGGRWSYPYSYPGRLEFDPRSPRKGWMKRGRDAAIGRLGSVLASLANAIERRFAA